MFKRKNRGTGNPVARNRWRATNLFRAASTEAAALLGLAEIALRRGDRETAARQLDLNPVLFAATNSSGGVMGKMISPQNIATGVSVTNMVGQEGVVFARTFIHSVVLTILLGGLVAIQQYLIPWVIPVVGGQ